VAFVAILLSSVPAAAQPQGTCTPGPETLCLMNDRFQVEVDWQDFSGNPLMIPGVATAGTGGAVHVPGDDPRFDSGYIFFYASENADLILKVLDGTQINGFVWLAAVSATNVEYTLRVIDTIEDREEVYRNPPGSQTIIFDTTAFPGLPNPPLGALTERGTERGTAGGASPEGLPPRAVRLLGYCLGIAESSKSGYLRFGSPAGRSERPDETPSPT
jgi:hypothetical protein